MAKLVLKDYINTILFGIVSYLVMDMHKDFKDTMKDVENLKIMVGKHDYILNLQNKPFDKKTTYNFIGAEAILPDTGTSQKYDKYKKS